MEHCIMVGCDLHDKKMILEVAEDRKKPETLGFDNSTSGRKAMIKKLLAPRFGEAAGNASIVFAYEASGQGFGLYDELSEAGIRCFVLAPTRIARSASHKARKDDHRDAERILEIVRGHVLAGNELPSVWIPDKATRDDREVVRGRLDLSDKLTVLKTQVRTLLKRVGISVPTKIVGEGWSRKMRCWLWNLAKDDSTVAPGAKTNLGSLLRQIEWTEKEISTLDGEVARLSQTERYAHPVKQSDKEKGVGILTAMTFLTEMGDLSRFNNRRQIGGFLGLVPRSNETGDNGERKGHITRQGPWRVRKVLCQATWSRVRTDSEESKVYQRLVKRNPKHKKIAVVACMRRLAIRLWRIGLSAQREAGIYSEARKRSVG